MAELKGVELKSDVPEDVWITCDSEWTEEALTNIMKNCVEHMKEVGVATGAQTGADGQSGMGAQTGADGTVDENIYTPTLWVSVVQTNLATQITIRDNGVGIDPEDLPHIFERFYKGKNSSKNSVGIGLAMARQIIMQQNGMISVASRLGEGTEFVVKMYS